MIGLLCIIYIASVVLVTLPLTRLGNVIWFVAGVAAGLVFLLIRDPEGSSIAQSVMIAVVVLLLVNWAWAGVIRMIRKRRDHPAWSGPDRWLIFGGPLLPMALAFVAAL